MQTERALSTSLKHIKNPFWNWRFLKMFFLSLFAQRINKLNKLMLCLQKVPWLGNPYTGLKFTEYAGNKWL